MSEWRSLNDVLKEDVEDSILELDRYQPRPAQSTYRMRRAPSPMGDKFLQGIEEKLTRSEKANYRKNQWLGGDATRPTD
jgi:hypothetical protein